MYIGYKRKKDDLIKDFKANLEQEEAGLLLLMATNLDKGHVMDLCLHNRDSLIEALVDKANSGMSEDVLEFIKEAREMLNDTEIQIRAGVYRSKRLN